MPESTASVLKGLDKDQLKKVSKAVAKQLAIKIAMGVVVAVTVSLISEAVLAQFQSTDDATAE